MKIKIFLIVCLVFLNFSFGQSKLSKDREAILSMCGCFEIEFNFAETFNYSKEDNYKPSEVYKSYALELAIPIVNQRKKISIQHLLIVGPESNQSIVKHWRQDWLYQNTDIYLYDSENSWKYISKNKGDVKGQWTQKVFQVDDSPRYEGSSSWVHVDGVSYWENLTPAPLPRREYTKRKDYNLMIRRNRHEITKSGWVHDQDNQKIIKKNNKKIILAEEKGYSPYKRVDPKRCKVAKEWWFDNIDKWTSVREEWNRVYARNNNLKLKESFDNKKLYEYLLFSNDYDSPSTHKKLINSFIIN